MDLPIEDAADEAIEETVQASIVERTRGQKNFHPFVWFRLGLNDIEWIQECSAWLVDEGRKGFAVCRAKNNSAKLKCHCLTMLSDKQYAVPVAEYLLFYGRSASAERDRIVMDMIRYQQDFLPPSPIENHRHFKLPYIVSIGDTDTAI